MRIVALEEHFAIPELIKRIDPDVVAKRGYPRPGSPSQRPQIDERLRDLGDGRVQLLDEAGITLQIMSQSGPGAELLPGSESPAWAREINDRLADAVSKKPGRLAGFAHLPLSAPEAAADELERAIKKLGFRGCMVNGTTDGLFLDDKRFEPVLERCEALGVPLYIHPGIPPAAIREAYYGGLAGPLSATFAQAGWGWHAECAVHVLRLALTGALDRHPKLQIIIGHLGEGLQVMMERFEDTFDRATGKILQRPVTESIRSQVHVTTSGFFNQPGFLALLQSFGADRILFSVDYPFSDNTRARAYLDSLPISPADKAKIAHGNADRLMGLKA